MKNKNSFLIFIFLFYILALNFVYAQEDFVEVKQGNIKITTLDFDNTSGDIGLPVSPVEGQIYYDFSANQPKYYNGTAWQAFGTGGAGGSADKTLATKIIAASNSQDNTRADYKCTGTQITGGDEVIINQAITDLGTIGGTVYLLDGTFWISGPIKVTANVSIIGTGASTIIAPKDGATITSPEGIIVNKGYYTTIFVNPGCTGSGDDIPVGDNNICLSNFKIDGRNIAGVTSGIYLYRGNYSKIDKLWITNVKGKAIRLDGFPCDNYSDYGSNYNILTNNSIDNCTYGFYAWWNFFNIFSGNIITGNILPNNFNTAFDGFSTSQYPVTGSVILGNVIYKTTANALNFSNSAKRNVIAGNVCSTGNANGLVMPGTLSDSNTITGNIFYNYNNVATSITLNSVSNNVVAGNVVNTTGTGIYSLGSGCAGNLLIGNNISNFINSSSNGIYLRSKYSLVSSNLITNPSVSGKYGMYLDVLIATPADNNYLIGNFVDSAMMGWGAIYQPLNTKHRFTDKAKITFEKAPVQVPVSAGTITTNLYTYIPLNPASAVSVSTIANGTTYGQLLILENIATNATYTITFTNGGSLRINGGGSKKLYPYETTAFIWNGSSWLEICSGLR